VVIGCNPYRKLNILQEPKDSKDSINYSQIQQHHIIQPGDLLYLKVYENNQEIKNTFDIANENLQGNLNSNAAVYLAGFPVSQKGTINHPTIGEISVIGLTIEEARIKIQQIFNELLNDVKISLKLLNHRFTVLGEVNSPGLYVAYNEQINILEALGQAGGFSEFANSERVKIIRKNSNGTKSSMFVLNLSNDKFLQSSKYYIQPNDIIYIEPLKSKSFNLTYKQISPLIGSISAAVSILNLSILIYQNSKK